ncbi:hypothetical protein [Streptomyces fuscichromogenes]|uniref:Uncharacterized protein n=1 Tax=Streptomyces fuscichromogenes TaxID=1324013 RepID=A0A917XNZ4_9ACTN|nr:hypothetical protein [Streptomyces fuscichromogenes]GGN45286.1 hypothetical protein GCM10011578_097080 [Streptomyces fuscichromogenes]
MTEPGAWLNTRNVDDVPGYLLAAEHLAKNLDKPEHTAALAGVVDGFIQAAINTSETAKNETQQTPENQGSTPDQK